MLPAVALSQTSKRILTMSDDEDVGYGRPPKQTRFKPGKSGNPRGRPKGRNNFSTDLKATLKSTVQITEKGKPKRISTQKAALMRLREKALSGDTRALDRLIDLARIHNDEELVEAASVSLAPSDQAILDRYVMQQTRHSADHEAPTQPQTETVEDLSLSLDEEDDDGWLK